MDKIVVDSSKEVIIAEAGKPVARILPVVANVSGRQPGNDKGKVMIMPDFDAPLEEFRKYEVEVIW